MTLSNTALRGLRNPRTIAGGAFSISALFHYFGPALAVLMFSHIAVPGVAWWRIVSAAVVLAVWRRPWRALARLTASQRLVLLALGAVLAAMNTVFYYAIDSLPLATVGALEFLGVIVLAAVGVRSRRNLEALLLAVAGVAILTDLRIVDEPLGMAFAFANCALFVLYVVLGHRVANSETLDGTDQLAIAMMIAAVAIAPFGLWEASLAFADFSLVAMGIAVGVCSSVIPYAIDQFVMARLSRASFALMMCLLPAMATVIGYVILGQTPAWAELIGIGLVIIGIARHRPSSTSTDDESSIVNIKEMT